MSPAFTVLVNSSDGFDDCWEPFFTLYRRYWPQAVEPVLLNTETKTYAHDGLALQCSRVQVGINRRLTWSECLLAALAQVQTPLVLYLQEDYFIDQPVLDDKVRAAAAYMLAYPQVKHVALTAIGSAPPYLDHDESWLQRVRPEARYRISTQAALWRVETLSSYVLPQENGWMFEICGSWRAQRRAEEFLVLRPGIGPLDIAIHYLHTGIIKGQWLIGIQEVFARNAIEVDFSRRGFYAPKGTLRRKLETGRQLLKRPGHVLSQRVGWPRTQVVKSS